MILLCSETTASKRPNSRDQDIHSSTLYSFLLLSEDQLSNRSHNSAEKESVCQKSTAFFESGEDLTAIFSMFMMRYLTKINSIYFSKRRQYDKSGYSLFNYDLYCVFGQRFWEKDVMSQPAFLNLLPLDVSSINSQNPQLR